MVPMISETNAMAEELGKKARYLKFGFYSLNLLLFSKTLKNVFAIFRRSSLRLCWYLLKREASEKEEQRYVQ